MTANSLYAVARVVVGHYSNAFSVSLVYQHVTLFIYYFSFEFGSFTENQTGAVIVGRERACLTIRYTVDKYIRLFEGGLFLYHTFLGFFLFLFFFTVY